MRIPRRRFLQAGTPLPVMASWLFKINRRLGLQKGYVPKRLGPLKGPRTVVSLTGEWRFQPSQVLGGVKGADPGLDDRQWPLMSVPDFWRPIDWWLYSPAGGASQEFVEDEQKRVSNYTFDVWNTRAGWYRHWIAVPSDFQRKRLIVRFAGVASVADVWWNGEHIRSHIGMFGPFECDVTPHVRSGEKNLLAVFVAAEQFQISAAEQKVEVAVTVVVTRGMIENLAHGDYDDSWPANRNGGIWSPVQLVISEPVRIEDVFFRPRLDGASIDIIVDNPGPESVRRSTRVRLYDDATGALFHQQTSGVPIRVAGGKRAQVTVTLEGLRPKLWSPDLPHLYRLQVLLEEGSQVSDQVELRVGFRTFEVQGARFYLNGHPYFLRGAGSPPYGCRPHDKNLALKFMGLMHAGNEVVTRFHTTGISETWATAADTAGVGVSVEGVWPWALTGASPLPPPDVVRYWQEDQLAMFRSLRNHPSILLWDINNEMRFHYNPVTKKFFDPDRQRRLKKWKIVSDTIKMTRAMDPTRPIIASSEYSRSREEFYDDLKPNDLDDGDIDDIHVYNGWYGPSGLFVNVRKDIEDVYSQFPRPLISQEASTGYPNNDTGYPVSEYIYPQYVAQAWLGEYVFAPSGPFLRLHAQTTQEWIEKIRRRRDRIAGWLVFSNGCWFQHVCDSKRIEPYPTYEAARKALQPILVSLDSPNRHFVSDEGYRGDVYIVNDDVRYRDLKRLTLDWSIQTDKGETLQSGREPMPDAPYYRQVKRKITFRMPGTIPGPRSDLFLRLVLRMDGEKVSGNYYPIVVVERSWFRLKASLRVHQLGNDPELSSYLESLGAQVQLVSGLDAAENNLTVVSAQATVADLGGKSRLQAFVAGGGRVLFLNPTQEQAELLPLPMWKISDRFGTSTFFSGTWDAPAHWSGECAFVAPGHPLAEDLFCPDDLRWWNSGPTGPSVCDWAFDRPRPGDKDLNSLCEYIAPHGYLESPQDFEKYRGVLVLESHFGKGKLFASMLRLADDPIAKRIIANLILALQRNL